MIKHLLIVSLLCTPILAADVPGSTLTGPDGETYPDVRYAGNRGGIPKIDSPVLDVTTHGANGADHADDHAAIMAAVAAAARAGGGVVYLPDGTYHLSDCIEITSGNIIVRGQSRERTILVLDNATTGGGFYDARSAIHFRGPMKIDYTDRFVAETAPAGSTTVRIKDHDYQPGDIFVWQGKPAATWLRVEAVDGDAITVNQPLRFDLTDGAGKFRKYGMIQRVGVENLTIQTPKELNTNGVGFYGVWEGWARNLTIDKPGRFPVGFNNTRYIEIRDCVFNDAWKKGSGGVGYGGLWSTADSLIDNVTFINLRHAPNLQDGANGCVIRNCTIEGSDAQWHTGGPLGNVIENCTLKLDSRARNSHTLRSSRPGIDKIHSPAGPNNVVWYCDFSAESSTTGADFGHQMNGWVFAYNRIVIAGGKDPLLRIWYDCADDFVLRGNVLATQNQRQGGGVAFVLKDAKGKTSGSNVRFIDNQFHGFPLVDGRWWTGPASPDVDQNNTHSPGFTMPPRPQPPRDASGKPVPSIYAWQLAQQAR